MHLKISSAKWRPFCPGRDELTHWPRGGFQRNFNEVIFQLILVIDGWSISCKIVLKWMPMDLTDGKSTLVQVMAWCRQATSHYLSQCWPRSLSPYGVIRPQWVKQSSTTLHIVVKNNLAHVQQIEADQQCQKGVWNGLHQWLEAKI